MPGFDNGCVYFEAGIDPRGTPPVVNQMGTNGKLLIGSVASPYVVCNVPTGSAGVAVTTGPGTLDFSYTGSRVEQVVYGTNNTLVTCGTRIPNDDTIPQITEGDQVLTATITPKHATNLLLIEATLPYYAAVGGAYNTFALFQDATTDAIASCLYADVNFNSYPNEVAVLKHLMVAGTTSATTFTVRAGQDAFGGTVVINCNGATGLLALGGTEQAIITITEFNPGGAGTSLASLTSLTGNSGGAVHPDGALNINVVGGTGVSVVGTPGTNTLTINSTSSGLAVVDATLASYTLAVQTGYITDNVAGVTYTLPATGALGDVIEITGKLGIATIAQNANQQICIGNAATTVGVAGTLTATDAGDCLRLKCITAGASTVWRVISSMGNWSVA